MNLEDAINLYAPDGILHLLCRERRSILKTILSEPFDPDLHYTLTYVHLYYALLDTAKQYLDFVPNKNDPTYKELEDYYNALEECDNSGHGVFPLTVNYRNWWNGPHLANKKDVAWFPLRVETVDGDKFHATVAKFEDSKITYGDVEFECNLAKTTPKPEAMGEAIFDGEKYSILFYDEEEWIFNPVLQKVIDRAWPYIIRSDKLLNERIEEELRKGNKNNGTSSM